MMDEEASGRSTATGTAGQRSVGPLACQRADEVDEAQFGNGEDRVACERLESLIAHAGSSNESWQLRKLRGLSAKSHAAAPLEDRPTAPTTTTTDREGDLYWQKSRLIWSRAGVALRTFTFEEDVRQACWAWLDTDETWEGDEYARDADRKRAEPHVGVRDGGHASTAQRALCIFLQTTVIIHMPRSGQEYVKCLDFEVEKVFPLGTGLLIQRALEREDYAHLQRTARGDGRGYDDHRAGKSWASLLDEPLPNLFYLRRPLDELKAVHVVDKIALKRVTEHTTSTSPICWSKDPTRLSSQVDEILLNVSEVKLTTEQDCAIIVTASLHDDILRIYAMTHSRVPLEITEEPKNLGAPMAARSNPRYASDHAISRPRHPPRSTSYGIARPSRGRSSSSTLATRGRISSNRKSSRIEATPTASRTSIVGAHPRTSVSTVEQSRVSSSSGALRRVSTGIHSLNHGHASRLANDGQQDGGSADEAEGMDEVMQLLDEFDEGDGAEEAEEQQHQQLQPQQGIRSDGLGMARRPSSSAIVPNRPVSMSRRRSSRAHSGQALPHGGAMTPAASTLVSGAASHLAITPFPKITTTVDRDDDGRRNAKARMSSAAAVSSSSNNDPFLSAPSMAAALSQRDEQSRMTQSSLSRLDSVRKRSNVFVEDDKEDDPVRDILPIFEQFGRGFAAIAMIDSIPMSWQNEDELKETRVWLTRPEGDGDGVLLHIARPSSSDSKFHTRKVTIRATSEKWAAVASEQVVESPEEAQHATEQQSTTVSDKLLDTVLNASDKCLNREQGHSIRKAFKYALYAAQKQDRIAVDGWELLADCLFAATCPSESSSGAVENEKSSWDQLLASSTHQEWKGTRMKDLPSLGDEGRETEGQKSSLRAGGARLLVDSHELGRLLQMLNHLEQDVRLDSFHAHVNTSKLASLMSKIAVYLAWPRWIDYCARLSDPDIHAGYDEDAAASEEAMVPEPEVYDVYEHLIGASRGDEARMPHDLSLTFDRTSKLLRVYRAFSEPASPFETMSGTISTHDENVARSVLDATLTCQLTGKSLQRLPFAVALPILEARQTCKLNPPARWSIQAFLAIGRRDLALQRSPRAYRQQTTRAASTNKASASTGSKTMQDLPSLPAICHQLFSKDYRLWDVGNMLQTSRAVAVKGPPEVNLSNAEEDVLAEQQKRIFTSVSDRIKATSIGRGMFLMDSDPIKTAEQIKMAPICLRIRMLCHCIVQHREPDAESAEMEWPEFHNGTATALQLAFDGVQVESSWIHSQTSNKFTSRHAGFIFGMGLSGQLRNLGKIHAHHYLSNRHPTTTIGLLLGIAVSFAGSCDVMAKALMSIHLVHTLPLHSKPLKTTMLEQSAALVGLGFVFLGSNDRWASRMALKAMGTDFVMTDDNQIVRRECFSLSAGFSLGLICLGKGRDAGVGERLDRDVLPNLEGLIKRFDGTKSAEGKAYSSGKKSASHAAAASSRRATDYASFQWKPEISLTTTPATIAMALIYLRSNRQDIASRLPLPTSELQLNEIRPDLLQIRVLCRSLIMWDAIDPSKAWIDMCLPEFLRFRSYVEVRDAGQISQLAFWNMRTGAIQALGLKYAGSNDAAARKCLLNELMQFQQMAEARSSTFFDKVRQQALRSGLDIILICLAMICAGSGDVEILKIIRRSLFRVDDMRYGNYMANTMAVGMLFLGGGRFSLSSSDTSVAALLLAFYPRFPITAQDNRAHLQVYRHLWIMAVEARLLSVEEVDSGETSATPIKIVLRQGEPVFTSTPCVLPKLDSIRSIHLASDRYFAAMLDVENNPRHRWGLMHEQRLFCMRHAASLSHELDEFGQANLLEQTRDILFAPQFGPVGVGEQDADRRAQQLLDREQELACKIAALTDRSTVSKMTSLVTSARLDRRVGHEHGRQVEIGWTIQNALLDCLRADKLDVLSDVVEFLLTAQRQCQMPHSAVQAVPQWTAFTSDIRFMQRLIDSRIWGGSLSGQPRRPLLDGATLRDIRLTLERKRNERVDQDDGLQGTIRRYAQSLDVRHATSTPSASKEAHGTVANAGLQSRRRLSLLRALQRGNCPSVEALAALRDAVLLTLRSALVSQPAREPTIKQLTATAQLILRRSDTSVSTELLETFVGAWIDQEQPVASS